MKNRITKKKEDENTSDDFGTQFEWMSEKKSCFVCKIRRVNPMKYTQPENAQKRNYETVRDSGKKQRKSHINRI